MPKWRRMSTRKKVFCPCLDHDIGVLIKRVRPSDAVASSPRTKGVHTRLPSFFNATALVGSATQTNKRIGKKSEEVKIEIIEEREIDLSDELVSE